MFPGAGNRKLRKPGQAFLYGRRFPGNPIPGVRAMLEKEKEDGQKTVPWEMTDPKPPVIQSGHMESRRENTK